MVQGGATQTDTTPLALPAAVGEAKILIGGLLQVGTLYLPEVNRLEQETAAISAPAVICAVLTKLKEAKARNSSPPLGLEWTAAEMMVEGARSQAQVLMPAAQLQERATQPAAVWGSKEAMVRDLLQVGTLYLPEVNRVEQETAALAAPAVTCAVLTKLKGAKARDSSPPLGLVFTAAEMMVEGARSQEQAL